MPCLQILERLSGQFGSKEGEKLTEGQFLKGSTGSLREVEEDEHNLEGQEAAIRNKVLPADVFEANRVNESGKEASCAPEKLKKGDTAGALRKRPKLDKIGC